MSKYKEEIKQHIEDNPENFSNDINEMIRNNPQDAGEIADCLDEVFKEIYNEED